jgi:hypothetical protein
MLKRVKGELTSWRWARKGNRSATKLGLAILKSSPETDGRKIHTLRRWGTLDSADESASLDSLEIPLLLDCCNDDTRHGRGGTDDGTSGCKTGCESCGDSSEEGCWAVLNECYESDGLDGDFAEGNHGERLCGLGWKRVSFLLKRLVKRKLNEWN